jgi:ATP-dependent protease ClpP protease subunit
MKIKKLTLGLFAALALAMVPASVLSKSTDKDTVTLSENNLILLNEVVDGESVGKAISRAKELKAKLSNKFGCHIRLVLSTPGGSIQAGLELVEALEGIGCKVDTITQFAASMGFQIAQNLGKRQILQNGVLMSHRASGGFEGEFGGKFPSQIDSRYALWKARLDEMDRKTVSRTGGKQTLESYQDAYDDELWLTGAQSVEQGYADEVVKVTCDSSLEGVTTHQLMFMGIIPVKYDLDKCPLNTAPMNIRVGILTTRGLVDSEDFIKNNGGFGPECLISAGKVGSGDAFCALDTSLTMAKVKELKFQFINAYENRMGPKSDLFKARKSAIKDYWGI